MFSLVQFDNGGYTVASSKKVQIVKNKTCLIKYKGAKYNCFMIRTADTERELEKFKEYLLSETEGTSCSTPKKNDILPKLVIRLSNIDDVESDVRSYSDNHAQNHKDVAIHTEVHIRNNDQSVAGFIVDHNDNERDAANNTEDVANYAEDDTSLNTKNDDTTRKDSDYIPDFSVTNNSKITSHSISKEQNETSLFDDKPSVDIQKLIIPCSQKTSTLRTVKSYFCPYCHKLETKFARHLEQKHKSEPAVKNFLFYDKQSKKRAEIIGKIRKEGIFQHNTNPEFNTGILMTARLRQEKIKNTAEDYACCEHCNGYYSKRTIRLHYAKCNLNHNKGEREILSKSKRKTGYIHACSSTVLRRTVFPVMKDDKVRRIIAYDHLIILYGNKLCEKYTHIREHDLIRAELRYLGKHKLAAKSIDNTIDDYASLFKPGHVDTAVKAIKIVASWHEATSSYKSPAVATRMTTLIKKCAKKFRSECIKRENHTAKKEVDNFLELWEEDTPNSINRKAMEDQVKKRRDKKQVLPVKKDIKILNDFLKVKCNSAMEILKKKFDYSAWEALKECSLLLTQIFNRRRAGDIEALLISDLENQDAVDSSVNEDIYNQLSNDCREIAKQFVRITGRGKLGRTIPILLQTFIVECINTIIKYRKDAGVDKNNLYVFSVATKNPLKKPYMRACPLLRKYSHECGAKFPSSLRGTILRKHVATHMAMLGIEEALVDRLANFMGHNKDIHKTIYRVPVPVAEITLVAKLLQSAMGDDACARNSDDSSDDDDDHGNNEMEDVIVSECNTVPGNDPEKNNLVSTDSYSDDCMTTTAVDKSKRVKNYNAEKNKKPVSCSSHLNTNHDENTEIKRKNYRQENTNREYSNFSSDDDMGKENSMVSKKHSFSSGDDSFGTKRRSTSPFGKTKRVKWTMDEREAVEKHFGILTDLPHLPSLDDCQRAVRKYKVLERRQPQQLKSFIDNQRRAKDRRESYMLARRNEEYNL